MTVSIEKNADQIAISGELNMQTVPEVASRMAALVAEAGTTHHNLQLDLSAISRSDSAGVALLVDVLQLAKKANLEVEFYNLPEQMRAIAGISGLLDILPIRPQ